MKNERKSKHELDLNLIKKFGYLSNNEVRLADKEFLNEDKVEEYGNFASELLKTKDPYQSVKKQDQK